MKLQYTNTKPQTNSNKQLPNIKMVNLKIRFGHLKFEFVN